MFRDVDIHALEALAGRFVSRSYQQDGDCFGAVEMVNKGGRTTTVKARTPNRWH